ncbi:GerMN domain-containing protein [Cellulosilyticum sp. I15G10I2]|uniref:GerMN domain-containing protein n=1 Tax=Cellulosilyticum sp. I15G10I2 TaxID=1892843 RepID=UPI00085C5F92|nr:GerMN domain-containing protein [Cellulosilyticum sp. I15G10I2]
MRISPIPRLFIVILLLPIIIAACNKSSPSGKGKDTITIYFADYTKGSLFSENIPVDLKGIVTNRDKTQFVISALSRGPQSTTLQNNNDMHIKEVNLDDRLAYVLFDGKYDSLSANEQMGIRASLVYSLTELNFIDGVEFFIEDRPILNINSKPIGPITRSDIILSVLNPNPPTTIQPVVLYFTSLENPRLIKEQRDIQVNNNVPLERYIIDELIKGPQQEGLLPTIPKETIVNDVNTKEGVCQVDLSFDVKSKHFTSPESKALMIYSIVNALTELPKIQKVAFLIDGKKEIEFSKDIDLSEFFERKEALIEND